MRLTAHNYPFKKAKFAFGLSALLGLIIGCTPSSIQNDINERYLTRLNSVLGQDVPDITNNTISTFPPAKSLVSTQQQQTISLFDLDDLQPCQLDTLVAERNTTLGKLQTPSQRLNYENEFLIRLTRCQQKTTLDDDTIKLIEQLVEHKSVVVQQAYWDMLVSEPSIRQLFNASSTLIDKQSHQYLELIEVLEYLQAVQEQLLQNGIVDAALMTRLESQLSKIDGYRHIGSIISSLQRAANYLDAATISLENAETITKCNDRGRRPEPEYLQNVFDKYYVKQTQAFNAELGSQWRQIQPLLESLYLHTPASKSHPWLTQEFAEQQHYKTFINANKRHAQRWMQFFKACGMNPTG